MKERERDKGKRQRKLIYDIGSEKEEGRDNGGKRKII